MKTSRTKWKIPIIIPFNPSLAVVQISGLQVGLNPPLNSLDDVGTVSTPIGEHAHCGTQGSETMPLSYWLMRLKKKVAVI